MSDIDLDQRLSPNFTLREFLRSAAARRLGIKNVPTEEQIENMRALAQNVLEPIRTRFGPYRLTSGFRSTALNKAIGGSSKSQHSKGEAADGEPLNHRYTNVDVVNWVQGNVEFDQLILEYYDPAEGPRSGWIHVSYKRNGKNRCQALTARVGSNGKVEYLEGIVVD